MGLECNIDAEGKAARLRLGIAAMFGGLVLSGLLMTGILEGGFWWLSTSGAVFGGAFAIFEARAGWCVVRAMGIRTPL